MKKNLDILFKKASSLKAKEKLTDVRELESLVSARNASGIKSPKFDFATFKRKLIMPTVFSSLLVGAAIVAGTLAPGEGKVNDYKSAQATDRVAVTEMSEVQAASSDETPTVYATDSYTFIEDPMIETGNAAASDYFGSDVIITISDSGRTDTVRDWKNATFHGTPMAKYIDSLIKANGSAPSKVSITLNNNCHSIDMVDTNEIKEIIGQVKSGHKPDNVIFLDDTKTNDSTEGEYFHNSMGSVINLDNKTTVNANGITFADSRRIMRARSSKAIKFITYGYEGADGFVSKTEMITATEDDLSDSGSIVKTGGIYGIDGMNMIRLTPDELAKFGVTIADYTVNTTQVMISKDDSLCKTYGTRQMQKLVYPVESYTLKDLVKDEDLIKNGYSANSDKAQLCRYTVSSRNCDPFDLTIAKRDGLDENNYTPYLPVGETFIGYDESSIVLRSSPILKNSEDSVLRALNNFIVSSKLKGFDFGKLAVQLTKSLHLEDDSIKSAVDNFDGDAFKQRLAGSMANLLKKSILEDDGKFDELAAYAFSKALVPVEVELQGYGKKSASTLWFYPNEEFLSRLPARYAEPLRAELEIKRQIENGIITPYEACKGAPTESFYGTCRLESGAVKNMKPYPNPASDKLNLEFLLKESRSLRISLHTLEGRFVKYLCDKSTYPAGTNTVSGDITGLTPGLYLVALTTDKGEQTAARIIVN